MLKYGARAIETDHEYDSDDRKVYYSDVVVYGEPLETVQGDYPFKDIDGVSTIKFNVLCVYKAEGFEVPSTIYIAGIGNENGQIKGCPAAPIGDSKSAVMFLKRTDKHDVFEIEFKPNIGEIDIILDDLSVACGLSLHEGHDEECGFYQPLKKDEGCVSWTPINIKKPEPEPEPESEEVEKTEPETPKEESTQKPEDTVVIDTKEDGKNNQSDQGYETKPETDQKTGAVSGSTEDENGSTAVTSSLLVTLITVFLTIVV